jgi:type IV pilus assembly protein PilF
MMRWLGFSLLLLSLGCAQPRQLESAQTLAASYSAMGFEYLQLNERLAARSAFREAIAHAPQFGDAYLGLALVFQREGEVALAEDYFRQAIRQEPQAAFWHAYGQFLATQERYVDSADFLQLATADVHYLGRALAFEDLAMVQLYQGLDEAARTAFLRAVRLDETLLVPHWHLTQLALAHHEPVLAHQHYQDLLALMDAGLIEHSTQTLQLGFELSEALVDEDMRQRLQQQLELIQLDQP